MNTFHLKYFIDAVRLGGVAASAEYNRLTHSAVSQSIRSLEKELGINLLDHEKRKFNVTEQGRMLFEQGRLWLQNLENMKDQVKDAKEKMAGRLKIACPQSIVREILWKHLVKYRKLYPQVSIKVVLGSADFVKNNVRNGNCDLGFLLDDEEFKDLKSISLYRGHYVLISRQSGVALDQFPLIVSSQSRMEVQLICRDIKRTTLKTPEVALEIQSWSLIRQFVKESDVFGIVPRFMVQADLDRGRLYEIKTNFERPEYEIKGVWGNASDINSKVNAFIRLLEV